VVPAPQEPPPQLPVPEAAPVVIVESGHDAPPDSEVPPAPSASAPDPTPSAATEEEHAAAPAAEPLPDERTASLEITAVEIKPQRESGDASSRAPAEVKEGAVTVPQEAGNGDSEP
jgi:hypothetical protein